MDPLTELTRRMIAFDQGSPTRIQHFLKVHSFARLIGLGEGLDEAAQFVLEAAALVHDIGIRPALEKYGMENGKLQEQEGPAPAREMLTALGFPAPVTERVCYLVAHHHTYTDVDGLDYQILLEADFLVNLYENHNTTEEIRSVRDKLFRTKTGTELCSIMFDLEGGTAL